MANIVILTYTLTSALGLIFLKLGSRTGAPFSFVDGKLQISLGLYVSSGILLYGFSFLIYTYLISKNDLGYIVPISTALVYIFIFTASFFIFKEVFTATKIIAILLILAGVALLNLSK